MLLRGAVIWLLISGAAFTQSGVREAETATGPTVDQVVDRIMQNDATYRSRQPSFTAHESIVSRYDEVVLFGHRVDKAEATVRMGPQAPGGPFKETRQITMYNGKPVSGPQPHVLYDFTDDFADFANPFFSAKHRHCYNFALEPRAGGSGPWQVDVSVSPAAKGAADCVFALDGLTAMVRVDPVTYQIVHLECNSPAALAAQIHRPAFVSADYAPVRVGEETYWLPTDVTAKGVIGKDAMKWVSHYSDYHRYTSTSTILPVDDSAQ